jgi:hypothetical protein
MPPAVRCGLQLVDKKEPPGCLRAITKIFGGKDVKSFIQMAFVPTEHAVGGERGVGEPRRAAGLKTGCDRDPEAVPPAVKRLRDNRRGCYRYGKPDLVPSLSLLD